MNFIKSLPAQLILNDFVSGKTFTLDQSERILRAIIVDSALDYQDEMAKTKRFLTRMTDMVITPNVASVKTEHEMSDVMMLMTIRFINIVYKGEKPIVINDEIVYLPKTLTSFDEAKIEHYVLECMRFVKHTSKVKVDAMPTQPKPAMATFNKETNKYKVRQSFTIPNKFLTKETASA